MIVSSSPDRTVRDLRRNCEIIADGDILVVEGVKDGKYHVVSRHSPPRGDFVDLCQAMLFMSGIDVRRLWFEYRE